MMHNFAVGQRFRIILVLLLAGMLAIAFNSSTVCAIPSLTPHTNNADTIQWEYNDNGVEDGSSAHNHRDGDNFFGQQGSVVPNPSLQPYSACGVWDNRRFRVDDNGTFDRGHGFINEWLWIKDDDGFYGGVDKIPRYRFDANVPPDAQDRVRDAFGMYDGIGPDRDDLVLGIAFTEVGTDPAEIVIRWQDIDSPGATSPTGGWGDFLNGAPVTVTFDSSRAWSYNVNPATVPVAQWHFLAVAIHEIGHVIGLDEQNDVDDVMYYMASLYGFVYVDNEPNGAVSVSDQRIEGHDGFMHATTGARYAEGTNVAAGDADIGLPLVAFPVNAKHTGNAPYDPAEIIYLDNDGDNKTSVGDTRMKNFNGYEGGSIVQGGDTDVGADLVNFGVKERHTGAGPWFQTLDAETTHGVRDLYSIPAPDQGDAPGSYPLASHQDFGFEWLGDSVDGESQPRINDNDDGVTIQWLFDPLRLRFMVSVRSTGKAGRYIIGDPTKLIHLNAWVDWNNDGSWAEAGDKIIDDDTFDGSSTKDYDALVPASICPFAIGWIRFRLSYGEEVVYEGSTLYGEVEDYKITFKLRGDLNMDGTVDIFDLVIVATEFGHGCYPPLPPIKDKRADINCDCVVDIFDLVIVAADFGKTDP